MLFYWILAKTWDSGPWPREPASCTRFLLDSCKNLGFPTLAQGSRFLQCFSTRFLQKPGILDHGPGIEIPVLVFYWIPAQTWDFRPWPWDPDSCTRFLLDSCKNLGFSLLLDPFPVRTSIPNRSTLGALLPKQIVAPKACCGGAPRSVLNPPQHARRRV